METDINGVVVDVEAVKIIGTFKNKKGKKQKIELLMDSDTFLEWKETIRESRN